MGRGLSDPKLLSHYVLFLVAPRGGPQNGFTSLTWNKMHGPFGASRCSPMALMPFLSSSLAPVGPPGRDLGCRSPNCQAVSSTAKGTALRAQGTQRLTTGATSASEKRLIVLVLDTKHRRWGDRGGGRRAVCPPSVGCRHCRGPGSRGVRNLCVAATPHGHLGSNKRVPREEGTNPRRSGRLVTA